MATSDETCGRCGQTLQQRSVRNVSLLACPRCRTVLLAERDLDRLLHGEAPIPELYLDDELPPRPVDAPPSLEPYVAPQARRRRAASLAPVLLGLFAGGGLLALVILGTVVSFWASRPAPVSLTSVQPRIVDEPTLPLVKATEIVLPEPEPPPAPAVGVGSLVSRGWRVMERSPPEAAELFQQALAKQPGHADANYGYGYALLAERRPIDARPFLCRALANGDAEIQRETRALLQRNQLACN